MSEKPKYPVQTVGNAIEILEILAKDVSSHGVGVTDISREMNMGKSSVHRILDTLLYYGYVIKDAETSRYRLGWGLYTIGQRVPQQNQIFSLDSAYLIELSKKTGDTVNLGVRDRDEVIIISKLEGTNAGLRVGIQVGEHEPIHATALGKMLISDMCDGDITDILRFSEFHKFTDNTLSDADELLCDLKVVRERGYSMDNQEFAVGMICIAMPIRDYTGNIIAAVSVSSPSNHMNEERIAFITENLRECCGRISWNTGYKK